MFGHTQRLLWLMAMAISMLGTRIAPAWANKYPCEYADTVNITDGLRLKDGAYSYGGVVVPPELIAEYSFKVIDGVEYRAPKHLRGCVCLLKPCISICCPSNMIFDAQLGNCTSPPASSQLPAITHIDLSYAQSNATNASGGFNSSRVIKILDHFVVRTELGCHNKFIDKKNASFWQWDLYENGRLSRDGRQWTTDEYCFTALEHDKTWRLTPLRCERHQRGYRVWIYAICSIIAILINIFIVSLLGSVAEARQSHYGQLIINYLLSIILGYSLLVYLALKNPMKLSHTACRNIGLLAYFCIMLSFVFLAICSFDFWQKFRLKSIKNWLRKLLLCVAVIAVVGLRFLVSFAQDSKLPKHLKPGIGEDYCWFDVRLWGIMIYYYTPIILLLIFSIFCCLKAYFASYELPRDTQNVLGTELRVMKTHFYAFSFYLVGVFSVWLREIIVYIMARMREHFFIIDFWSGICILGLAIAGFILLLGKNMHVKAWWAVNVDSSQTDLSIINARVYKFDEKGDLKSRDSPYQPTVTSL